MAHFAQLDDENIIIRIVCVANETITDESGKEVEELGIQHLKLLCGDDTRWVQTSYNDSFRRQYASCGGVYDPIDDVFIDPKPLNLDSFILRDGRWYPPVDRPTEPAPGWSEYTFDGWIWDEENIQWSPVKPPPKEEP